MSDLKQILLYHVQSTARQLPAHHLPVHEAALHLQRDLAALLAQQVPRQRLLAVRHRSAPKPALPPDQRGLRVAAIPARHHVPLSDPLPGRQHPRLRGSVRAAHKPLQREDLHLHLVLAHLRGHRQHVRPPRLALVLAAAQSRQLPQEVPQAHGPHQPREVRQEAVRSLRGEVSTTRWRSRSTSHRQELQPGDHGRGHVRFVGQLQV